MCEVATIDWVIDFVAVGFAGFFIAFLMNRVMNLKWALWRMFELIQERRIDSHLIFTDEEKIKMGDAYKIWEKWP